MPSIYRQFGIYFSIISASLCIAAWSSYSSSSMYKGQGTIAFVSNAPLEKISAQTSKLNGVIELDTRSFAFSVPLNSFEGFNSPLQKEHFNEHYMETERFPKASFVGKIIGLDSCLSVCDVWVKARGKLTIHGETNVVSIPIHFYKKNGVIEANATFDVRLDSYNIDIPALLESKISPVIHVSVNTKLTSDL